MKSRSILMLVLSLILALMFLTLGLTIVRGAEILTRVTTASTNGRDSLYPGLSADGTKIVFESNSDFLGQSISTTEIWLYDTTTMTYTRITTASASDRFSSLPSLSADGKRIAFRSSSDFLNQGIPSNQQEIWLYDLTTETLTRVTTASGIHLLDYPSLSANGKVIAFESDFDFLGQGVNSYEIWLYDTTAMTVTRITTAAGDGFRESRNPSLNANGTKVAFRSNSDFLGQGIPESQFEIWLYDTTTMTLTRVTTASDSTRGSAHPYLSTNGTKSAFASDSDFLDQGIPQGQYEIWLYDTTAATFTRVTTASASNRQSAYPRLNTDGTKVVFVSDSDFLGQDIPDDQFEVWLYDTMTMTYTRITSGSSSNADNYMPTISADGTKIAFSSDADLLGQGIPNGQFEIWLYGSSKQQIYLPLVLK
jgi:Tol biopolymer transport system component